MERALPLRDDRQTSSYEIEIFIENMAEDTNEILTCSPVPPSLLSNRGDTSPGRTLRMRYAGILLSLRGFFYMKISLWHGVPDSSEEGRYSGTCICMQVSPCVFVRSQGKIISR